jgi:uncharacterized protein (DUF1800 family)
VTLYSEDFDDGVKTVFEGKPFEVTGNLGVENADGLQFPPNINVIDILFTHTDSEGRPTVARFISKKLWEWFANAGPALSLVDELADVFVASGYEIRPLVKAILVHDAFYTDEAMSGATKNPADFANQMIIGLQSKSKFEDLPGNLDRMGMDLFNPPSVNGWNADGWMATGRLRERFFLAQRIAAGRSKKDGGYVSKVDKLFDRNVSTTAEIIDGLLARFGVRNLPAESRQTLIDYLDGGVAMSDEEWLEIKFRGVLVLIFTLPEFQIH